MSAVSIGSVRICEGVVWESISGRQAQSYFPEHALDRLAAAGLYDAILHADPGDLRGRLGEQVKTGGDDETNVRVVREDPSLVVKLAPMPFSYLAMNVALEAALGTWSRVRTPAYLGALVLDDGRMVSVMSRAEGKPVNDLGLHGNDQLLALEHQIQSTGEAALARVGIRPTVIVWDTNDHNLFVPMDVTRPAELPYADITIIDQMSACLKDAKEWYGKARITDEYGDPRDREAEAESELAWAQYAAVTAA